MSVAGYSGTLTRRLAVATRWLSDFLIEPAGEPVLVSTARAVAVVALGPRCGTTTLTHALASVLGAGSVVTEAAHGEVAGPEVASADLVLLVAGPEVEPAMVRAAVRSFGFCAGRLRVVLIRGEPQDPRSAELFDHVIPPAPWAAKFAARGLPPLGSLGAAVRALVA